MSEPKEYLEDVQLNLTDDDVDEQKAALKTKKGGREDVRKWLAYSIVALVALTTVGGALLVAFGPADSRSNVEQMFQTVFPGLLGLAGSATGFYYGSKND